MEKKDFKSPLWKKLEVASRGWATDCGWSVNPQKLYDFISQELEKAREEGKREAFTKDEWFMLKLAMNDIFNNGNTAYEEISEKIKGYLN